MSEWREYTFDGVGDCAAVEGLVELAPSAEAGARDAADEVFARLLASQGWIMDVVEVRERSSGRVYGFRVVTVTPTFAAEDAGEVSHGGAKARRRKAGGA